MNILILGGYGTFGGRVAQLLADEPALTLLIAGRSPEKAQRFCDGQTAQAKLVAQQFDRNGDLESQLKRLQPDVLVDASGPFQAYGADPYRLVRTCLNLGVHYLDFADGSDFVKGIEQFDEEARSRGLYLLSGVSSFPVLTAAVLRKLMPGLIYVNAIRGGIAPSPYARVGLNVIRAIASYAGQPVKLQRDGHISEGFALTETLRYTIAPPGHVPLRNTRFSLVDVPDLQVLPPLWPKARQLWMGAGPVPEVLQRMLNGLSWLVRWRLLKTLSPFARLFYEAINILRWGEHRGGMFVEVDGLNERGQRTLRSWHLLAEGDDGPYIPSMAIEGILRHSLSGNPPKPGARPAITELELEDYGQLFQRRAIVTGQRERLVDEPVDCLYRDLLGDIWHQLPTPIQDMHQVTHPRVANGEATVERGQGFLARLTALIFGFPKAGEDVPVEVRFQPGVDQETWQRRFAGKGFRSLQEKGQGRSECLLSERFGPFRFGLALVLGDGEQRAPSDRSSLSNPSLHLVPRNWSLCGIPLPTRWAPRGLSYESAENGRFNFHVEISHPWTGLIVRYRGWLVPCQG